MTESTLADSINQNSDSGGAMFHEASSITIHGGTFTAYGSGVTEEKKNIEAEKRRIEDERQRNAEKQRRINAMALLSSRAEHGAPYDAAAREDVPKCHEHTRVAIIKGIHKWARSQERNASPLMWIYGPAGSGKTTIMQSVAESLDRERILAASFFFSRIAAARPRTKQNFVFTIAHQLSLSVPALQQLISEALLDTSILTKSLAKQLDVLVIAPLNKLDPTYINPPCIFVIDGLDECDDHTSQRDVLDLLERFLHEAPPGVRILLASRPLSHLHAFFARGGIREITQTTPLDNDYQLDEDITKFFVAKFENIRNEHPARGGIPSKWPGRSDIDVLVKRASGQFIYASVVMKFISDHGRHPNESLRTIISLKGDNGATAYEELDAIYAQILSTIEPQNIEFVKTLMGCLLLDTGKFYFAQVAQSEATTAVDVLFMIHPGTTDARINRIYPLITASSEGMKFSHASFPEYLLDHSRSQEFFLDMRKVHCTLARCWFDSYSAHFKLHPHNGIVPSSAAGYPRRLREDGQTGMVYLDVISHCKEAEWTSELRRDILTFDVRAALSASPKWINRKGEHILWYGAVIWVDFLFWIEQHHLLPIVETEHMGVRIQSVIQLLFVEMSAPPTVMRVLSGLLTWRKLIDIWTCWRVMERVLGQRYGCDKLVYVLNNNDSDWPDHLHICEAACLWLSKLLAVDMQITGLFFADGNLYADLALLYAQAQHIEASPYSDWHNNLAVMLSKACPSDELATFLMQNFLQLKKSSFTQEINHMEFMMAVCIYLFCGVPFLAEHQHGPEFDPNRWICGICILFDAECPNIELSLDPALKPDHQPAHLADEEIPQPLQIPRVRHFVQGVPLLWLQAWIIWLADMVMRYFPVVA